MRANKPVKFMVTLEQFERIRNKAIAKGFVTVSAYMRNLALEHDLAIEEKIHKVYSKIVQD